MISSNLSGNEEISSRSPRRNGLSSSNNTNMRGGWRVKLYELEQSGTWVDHGIGFAYIQLVSSFNGPALCVISESNQDHYLLESKIQSEDLYEKQGETIILWKEADFSGNIDYALSFQEADGCSFIWNGINEVQNEYMQQREYGSIPSFARTQRIANGSNGSTQSSGGGIGGGNNINSNLTSGLHSSLSTASSSSDNSETSTSFTIIDENHLNIYNILPIDHSVEAFLPQVKLKLESLHPSQRDYVSAQLLHEVRALPLSYWFLLFCLFVSIRTVHILLIYLRFLMI
jgi:hypothetical protein